MNGTSITREQATRALLRSGYLLESRLEQAPVARGYYVDARDAYPYPTTGKSRELDLVAMSARPLWLMPNALGWNGSKKNDPTTYCRSRTKTRWAGACSCGGGIRITFSL